MKDPNYRKAHEALEHEFELARGASLRLAPKLPYTRATRPASRVAVPDRLPRHWSASRPRLAHGLRLPSSLRRHTFRSAQPTVRAPHHIRPHVPTLRSPRDPAWSCSGPGGECFKGGVQRSQKPTSRSTFSPVLNPCCRSEGWIRSIDFGQPHFSAALLNSTGHDATHCGQELL